MKFINQLKRFTELLEDINSTTSTLEKVEILKKKKDDTESMKLLKLAIDPSFTFGLTKAKIRSFEKNVISHTIESEYSLSEILSWLTLRTITGDSACSLVKTLEMCLSECDDKENLINTLHNIIDKNLGVRIGAKEINKAIPNHIFEFSVALAEKYHDKKNSELVNVGKWFLSQKLDGCVHYDSLIKTKKHGYMKIGDFVESCTDDLVLSFDHKKKRNEYKRVLNHVKNGNDISEETFQWFEIILDDGKKLKLTGNHRVWCENISCYRRVDELDGTETFRLE